MDPSQHDSSFTRYIMSDFDSNPTKPKQDIVLKLNLPQGHRSAIDPTKIQSKSPHLPHLSKLLSTPSTSILPSSRPTHRNVIPAIHFERQPPPTPQRPLLRNVRQRALALHRAIIQPNPLLLVISSDKPQSPPVLAPPLAPRDAERAPRGPGESGADDERAGGGHAVSGGVCGGHVHGR